MASHGCWFEWIWSQLREMLLDGSLRKFSGRIRWGREALAQDGCSFCFPEGKAGLLLCACLRSRWWGHLICTAIPAAILHSHWDPRSLAFNADWRQRLSRSSPGLQCHIGTAEVSSLVFWADYWVLGFASRQTSAVGLSSSIQEASLVRLGVVYVLSVRSTPLKNAKTPWIIHPLWL